MTDRTKLEEVIALNIQDEVIQREFPHYIGGIINEIAQAESGGYFCRETIKNQLDRIMNLCEVRIKFDD